MQTVKKPGKITLSVENGTKKMNWWMKDMGGAHLTMRGGRPMPLGVRLPPLGSLGRPSQAIRSVQQNFLFSCSSVC